MFAMILLTVLVMLCVADTVLAYKTYRRLTLHDAERKLDAQVQEAMDEEQRRSRDMDIGFDNLMRFEVRGSDGFGGVT